MRYADANHTTIDTGDGRFIPTDPLNSDYAALIAAGTAIGDYVAPPPPMVDAITDRQFWQGCAMRGLCTEADALAAVKTGTLPAPMEAFVTQLPADQQFGARMILSGATTYYRSSPITAQFAQLAGMTPDQCDDFWRFCWAL